MRINKRTLRRKWKGLSRKLKISSIVSLFISIFVVFAIVLAFSHNSTPNTTAKTSPVPTSPTLATPEPATTTPAPTVTPTPTTPPPTPNKASQPVATPPPTGKVLLDQSGSGSLGLNTNVLTVHFLPTKTWTMQYNYSNCASVTPNAPDNSRSDGIYIEFRTLSFGQIPGGYIQRSGNANGESTFTRTWVNFATGIRIVAPTSQCNWHLVITQGL